MRCVLVRRVVPTEVMVAVSEVDISLVEYGCPLERRLECLSAGVPVEHHFENITHTMQSLAGCAMAVFRSQRLVSAKLVLHFSTMTLSLPLHIEILRLVMHAIWLSVFPLIDVSLRSIASLILMSFLVLSHF